MDPPPVDMGGPVPDRGPEVIRLMWALTSLAFITSALRVFVRLRHRMFGWDDVFMVFAMVRNSDAGIAITT